MKNNTVFGHVGLSRNTEKQLTPGECLAAKKALTTLFNPGNIAITVDSIAKVSFKAMTVGGFKDKAESLGRAFQSVGLAGGDIISKAINFAKRIISSEGADGPALFAQDPDCFDSMKYVLDVSRADILPTLQTIRRRFNDIEQLTHLPQLKDFFKDISDLKEVFRNLLLDCDVVSNKSEYLDIESKLNSYVRNACVDFCEKQNVAIAEEINALVSGYDLTKLTDEQKKVINQKGERIRLSEGIGSLDDLKDAINEYNLAFNPGGPIKYGIKTQIEDYLAANKPPTDYGDDHGSEDDSKGTGNSDDTGDSATTPEKKSVRVKKNLSKADLKVFISQLLKTVEEMADIDSVEFNLE